MKILMMTNTYVPVIGGVEESIQAFTRQFRKKGHQVLIVAPEFEGTPRREEGVIRIPAIQKFNKSDFSVNLPIPGFLSKLVKDFNPDIVHSHHPFLIGDMALRLSGQYDIPMVFTYHTMYEDYLHYLPFYNKRIRRFVIELSTGYANMTDHVIVPSESVYKILRDRGVDVPMDIVPTGVDTKKFKDGNGSIIRKRYEIPEDAFVVGHLGRMTPEKNLIFLGEAVAKFIKQDKNCHFLAIGKGPLDAELRIIFEKNGIGQNLHLTGALKDQDVVDGYHAMDVFAFASHTETQGLVLAEAMAAGIPIVAVDAIGVREAVHDGKNGRVIPKEDLRMFVDALTWCRNLSLSELSRMKDHASKYVQDFSIDKSVNKELEVYGTARSENLMLSDEKHTVWSNIMHRIKTEWDMAKNFVEASEAALHDSTNDTQKTNRAGNIQLDSRHEQSWIIKARRWLNVREWTSRLLNLKRSQATEAHPGLVMIQIDGFSRTQLLKALRDGTMPFLQKLINDQNYKTYPLYTGLPSSTPSVQGELFYGIKKIVPAFAFFDRKNHKVLHMYHRGSAMAMEDRLKEKKAEREGGNNRGLLTGGSSYSNVYSGGAMETHFCAVKIGWDMLWRGVNPFKIMLLWVTQIFDFLWIIFLLAVEVLVATYHFVFGICSGRNFRKELKFIPTRVFICILLRELVVMGSKMDIARGLPVIHMNLIGYDEQAHRRGPSSQFAHQALRGIDNTIAKIYTQAIHSTRRNYDIWVYSDHGQEDSISYIEKYGKTVKKAITEIYEEFENKGEGVKSGQNDLHGEGRSGIEDHEGVQAQRSRYLGDWFPRQLLFLIGVSDRDEEKVEVKRPNRIIVTAIGPTGNIYLPVEFNEQRRESFARRLVKDAQIPAVLAPDGTGGAIAWNSEGKFHLPEDAKVIIGADHLYLEELTNDLIEICRHPEAGAFTFIGWKPGEYPLTFPIESGAHAGPGTEETNAFALLPPDIISSLDEPAFLRTEDIRRAALKLLKRLTDDESVLAAMPANAQDEAKPFKGQTVRVMTYNVHSCVGVDGKISPERIARVIGRHNPDIVALQELDLKRVRTGGIDQPHIIAKELEMIYHFHPTIMIEEEHYGSAVLTRFPMKMVKADKLPGLRAKPYLEARGAMWCQIDIGNGVCVQFINTHLGLRHAERLAQVRALCGTDWLEHPNCMGPIILCGDFNAFPRSSIYKYIRRKLKDSQVTARNHDPRATWFSHLPVGRIDHVFVSTEIKVTNVTVPQTDLDKKSSDHLSLIVDLHISSKSM